MTTLDCELRSNMVEHHLVIISAFLSREAGVISFFNIKYSPLLPHSINQFSIYIYIINNMYMFMCTLILFYNSKMSTSVHNQIQQDWNNREFVEIITSSITKISEFLNAFDLSARSRLAMLNQKLTAMERQVDYIEAQVSRI